MLLTPNKRDLQTVAGWARILHFSKFYDLNLYHFVQTSEMVILLIHLVDTFQSLSFLYIKFSDNIQLSLYHKDYYSSFLPYLSMTSFMDLIRGPMLVTLSLYFLSKFIIFSLYYVKSIENMIVRTQSRVYLQIIFGLNYVDIKMAKAPIVHLIFSTLLGRGTDIVLYMELLAVGCLIIFTLELVIHVVFSYDFQFKKDNIAQTRNSYLDVANFTVPLVLGLLRYMFADTPLSVMILVNLISVIYGGACIYQIYFQLEYLKNPLILRTYVILNVIFFYESCCALTSEIYRKTLELVDFDFYFVIMTLFLTNLLLIFYSNKVKALKETFVYRIKNSNRADQYMEVLTMLHQNMKQTDCKLDLFAVLANHIKRCTYRRCLCTLVKYHYGDLRGRNVGDEIERQGRGRIWIKPVLYDDMDAMNQIVQEHETSFDKNAKMTAINLQCDNIKQVFSNFYFLLVQELNDDIFRLFTSYSSYAIFECKNCVGCLINIYNYIFSLNYQKNYNLYRHFILQNYIQVASNLLQSKFIESDTALSKERFYNTYEYFTEIEHIKEMINKLIEQKFRYFSELSDYRINFKRLIKLGQSIIQMQNQVDKKFSKLFEISKNNSMMIRLFIDYKKKIYFETNKNLKEYFNRLKYLLKRDEKMISMTEAIQKKQDINLFSNMNQVVFVNIYRSHFYITKCTQNFPQFFDYDSDEIKHLELNDFMPKAIRRHHDNYVRDFLNRKKGSRLKVPHFITFGLSKYRELKVISLVVKLEFFLIDDIYLCGIINSHPRNNQRLILTEDTGRVLSMNRKAKKLVGEQVYLDNYSLFLSIPTLLKYYYPEVSKTVKYREVVKRKDTRYHTYIMYSDKSEKTLTTRQKSRDMKTALVQKFTIELDEFSCFMFKVFLKEVNQIKTDEVASNISYLWKVVREKGVKKIPNLYPKHLKILTKIISTNRALFKKNLPEVLKVNACIEKYRYKNGLSLRVLVLSDICPATLRTQKFFELACESYKGSLADIFLVSPSDIDNIYQLMKIEKEMVKIVRSSENALKRMKTDVTSVESICSQMLPKKKLLVFGKSTDQVNSGLTLKPEQKPNSIQEEEDDFGDYDEMIDEGLDMRMQSNYNFEERIISKESSPTKKGSKEEDKEVATDKLIQTKGPNGQRLSKKNLTMGARSPSKKQGAEEVGWDTVAKKEVKMSKSIRSSKPPKSSPENLQGNLKKGDTDFSQNNFPKITTLAPSDFMTKEISFEMEDQNNNKEGNNESSEKQNTDYIGQKMMLHPGLERISRAESPSKLSVFFNDNNLIGSESVNENFLEPKPTFKEVMEENLAPDHLRTYTQMSSFNNGLEPPRVSTLVPNPDSLIPSKPTTGPLSAVGSKSRSSYTDDPQVNKIVSDAKEKFKALNENYDDILKNPGIATVIHKVKNVIKVDQLKTLDTATNGLDESSASLDSNQIKKIKKMEFSFEKRRNDRKQKLNNLGFKALNNSGSSANHVYKLIKLGIVRKLNDFSYKKVELTKQLLFILLLIFSISIRHNINILVNSYRLVLNDVVKSQLVSVPESFLHKEMFKKKLLDGGYIRRKDIQGRLFQMGFWEYMRDEIFGRYQGIKNKEYGDFTGKSLNYQTKFSNLETLKRFDDIGFLTLYFNSAFDYQILIKHYSEKQDDFTRSEYFNLDSTIHNSYEMIDLLVEMNASLGNTYQELVNTYDLYYLIFVLANIFLTVTIAILLTLMSLRINEDMKNMSSLLLKIEKKFIDAYKNRFMVYVSSINLQMKKKMDKYLAGGSQIELLKQRNQRGQNDLEEMERKPKTVALPSISGISDHDNENDDMSEKMRELFEMKHNSGKGRYNVLTNGPKTSKSQIVMMMIAVTILVNTPIAIDYLLQRGQMAKIEKLNNSSKSSAFLCSNVVTFYALFYSEAYYLYIGDSTSEEVILEKQLLQKVKNRLSLRIQLQANLASEPGLQSAQDISYCEYLQLTEPDMTLCKQSAGLKTNQDMFLGMSDLHNYYETVISSIKASRQNLTMSSYNFRNNDMAAYYISKALNKLNENIMLEIVKVSDKNQSMSYIFFGLFPTFLLVYYLFYKAIWIERNKQIFKKLRNTFLALPPRIIISNSYIKNYFSLRRANNAIRI